MNELVFVRKCFNVVEAQFYSHEGTRRVQAWYLPFDIQKYIHVGDVEIISKKKRVKVLSLSYDKDAELKYEIFPYKRGLASWQVQHIGRHLMTLGYQYFREQHFKKLINSYGASLGVDIAFQMDGHWCAIEYNGVHHYVQHNPRYGHYAENMKVKRQWCHENGVPLLEIPFWWQNDLDELVDRFISVVQLEFDSDK